MSIIVNSNSHMNNNVNNDSENALDEIEELIDWNLQYHGTTYHCATHWLAYSALTCTITFKLGLQPAMESLVRG